MRHWLIGLLLLPLVGWGHPVSLTWANVRINGDQVTVNFKVLLEDLIYFHHPEHDGYYQYNTDQLRSLAELHGKIIEDYFYLTDAEGQRISLTMKAINTNALSGEQIAAMDLMRHSIHYRLTATLPAVSWAQLTFHQAFDQHEIGIPSVTFLTAYSAREQLATDVEVAPGQPFILLPTGNQPPINPSRLTSSYFTITPLGIRHELTLPYKAYVQMTSTPTPAPHNTALSYFANHNPITADDLVLTPELRNYTALQSEDGDLLQPEHLVYLDLYYPTDQPAQQVAITWSDYHWQWRWFKSSILTMDSTYQHTFSRYQPTFFWERTGTVMDMEK